MTGGAQVQRALNSRSYYSAEGKLRAYQEYDDRHDTGVRAGVWEEYRYDPLGRRVMVRTRRPSSLCTVDAQTCITSLTRTVWSGDQILWELKSAEGSYGSEAGGQVSYTHAGGIDRPLAIWKQGVGSIITHQNWRGQFARGTFWDGRLSDCTSSDTTWCVPVPWPGYTTTAWHDGVATIPRTGKEHYWFGSLAAGMRDASGQMYMRNRYYDPQTGQFTQTDPIGLAGGLNAYGFAAGDPVTYSDPYGLCPPVLCGAALGAVTGAGIKMAINAATDRPLMEDVGKWAIGGAAVGATLGLGYSVFGAQGMAAASPWVLPATARGVEIEQRLGANLPQNFPTIDRFVNGVATSIKSVDLGAKTYQNGAALLGRLNGYVNAVANFSGGRSAGVTVRGSEVTERVLHVAIPAGRMTSAQQEAFATATARAAQRGVHVFTSVVP